MLINLRNALMAGKRLPYDSEVEYLESTGTQWIDTGYVPDLNTTTKATFAFTSTRMNQALAGAISVSGRNVTGRYSPIIIGDTTGKFAVFTGLGVATRYDFANADTNTHTIEFNAPTSHAIIFDGESIGRTVDVVGSCNSLTICCRNYDASALPASVKIFGLQIYQNGTLVRDYIPVRKGTVGYLYDRVSGALFGNAGTGDFVLGQDVVPVEYIESHGTEYIDTGVMSSRCYGAYLDFKAIDFASYMFFVCNATADDFCVGTNANSATNPYIGRIRRSLWYSGSIDKTAFVALSCKGGKILLNDVEKGTYDDTLPLAQNDNTIRMFGLSGTQRLSKCAIRRFDLYNSSQEAIFKALPVRVGTEGAMMDVLTRRIYRNQGTGAFGYGNDLKYPIPAS